MKRQIGSKHLLMLVVVALPLSLACAARNVSPGRFGFSKVAVLPFTIEPQLLSGAQEGRREVFVQLLAEEASASAARAVLNQHLAVAVERLPAAANTAPGQVLVTGTVRLPVTLPPGLDGLRADSQKGPLAVATVKLFGIDGKVLGESTVELTWREADWLTGGWHFQRKRPVDAVLLDAVREVVERAVTHLELQR